MPEQPLVSTSASSITPSLTFRVSLHMPCCGAHQPMPWERPEMSRDLVRLDPLALFGNGRRPVLGTLGDDAHVFDFM